MGISGLFHTDMGFLFFVINYIGSFRGFLGFPFIFDIFANIGLMLEARVGVYIYHIHIHTYIYIFTHIYHAVVMLWII